jgi:hypothetical protein
MVSETLKSLVLERRDHLSSAFPLRFEPGSHGQCLFGAKGAIKAGRIELSGGGLPRGGKFCFASGGKTGGGTGTSASGGEWAFEAGAKDGG